MALTYTIDSVTHDDGTDSLAATTSNSLTFVTGDVITVLFASADNDPSGTLSITNSGSALTWNSIATTNTTSQCKIGAWWAVAPDSTSRTVTVSTSTTPSLTRRLHCIVHSGAHDTTPVPVGKIYSGVDTDGDTTQSITPTASGSCLWMIAADWNAANTYAAAANCTLQDNFHDAGLMSCCLIRPTTQPRSDANAFTIGETDTGATNVWVAFEVQAAGGASQSNAPRAMFMLTGVG